MHNQREGSCNASDSNYNLGGWRCGHHFKLYCGMNVDSVCGRNSWYVLFFSPSWRRRGVATAYGRGGASRIWEGNFRRILPRKSWHALQEGDHSNSATKRPLCHSDGQGGIFPGASHHLINHEQKFALTKTTVMNNEKFWQKRKDTYMTLQCMPILVLPFISASNEMRLQWLNKVKCLHSDQTKAG